MEFIWYQSETLLNPMQKEFIKIGSQLTKKSGNIDTKKKKKKKKSVELITFSFFEVG